MYCTQCGTRLDDAARFCTSCGSPTRIAPQGASVPTGSSGFTGSTAPGAGTAAPVRKLRRVMAQKKIAGVCAGFAEYFDTDLTVMRIVWIALLLLPPHLGLIAYIVSWAVLPKA